MSRILLATESSIRKSLRRKAAPITTPAAPVTPKVAHLADRNSVIEFAPKGETVVMTIRGHAAGWTAGKGTGTIVRNLPIEEARSEYRRLLNNGYKPW